MSFTYKRVTNGENDRTRFGIGINARGTNSGALRGRCMDVACLCWFTTKGETTPLAIKFIDSEGEVETVENVRVNYRDEKNYDGFPSTQYGCTIITNGRQHSVKLVFFKMECRWIMVF